MRYFVKKAKGSNASVPRMLCPRNMKLKNEREAQSFSLERPALSPAHEIGDQSGSPQELSSPSRDDVQQPPEARHSKLVTRGKPSRQNNCEER